MDFPVDPSIALKPIPISHPAEATWPLHKVQYVIELVGPRTVPSGAIKQLLDKQWQDVLGRPQAFVMAPSDAKWRRLDAADPAQSYDSVALAWDLLSEHGALTSQSAGQLFQAAEQLATRIERRAMPLPVPTDVENAVITLTQIKESLDIGVNLSVVSRTGFVEESIWKACAALGLEYGSQGEFEWRIPSWPLPLLSISPLREGATFNLGSMQKGTIHDGLIIGFRVPLSPAPIDALRAAFHVADTLAAKLVGIALDENDDPLDTHTKQNDQKNLQDALGAFQRVQIQPGSPEAIALWN